MSVISRKVVVLVASHDTQNFLKSYADAQGFDLNADYDGNPRSAERFDFHVTLVASANEVFVPETQHVIEPVELTAEGFDVLGKDRQVPVLKLKASTELQVMRQFFVDTYGIEPTFADYKPHVTLSYAWSGTPALEDLDLPTVPLVFDQLRVKSLDAPKATGRLWSDDRTTFIDFDTKTFHLGAHGVYR